jgi:hypothetical protein
MSKWLSTAAIAAVLALQVAPAFADQYDGKWVIDFPSTNIVPGNDSNPGCAGMRIVADVRNDQISGHLRRETNSPTEVTSDPGLGMAPLSGTVAPDGTVTATWQGYAITGKLAGDTGVVNVTGECGPRQGKAERVEN